MTFRLNSILLVDDDEATNFIHELVLKQAGCVKNVVVVKNGNEALNFIKSSEEKGMQLPELIFLDINMPAMNGWEFMTEYEKFDDCLKSKEVVVMLTTSLNPLDKKKSESYRDIASFKIKPMTVKIIEEIIDTHFQNN